MLREELRKRITEELVARRLDRWVTGTIAVLLVAVGFLAGRWTSLTSNATPIVFQDLPGAAPVSNEDLLKLATEPVTPTPGVGRGRPQGSRVEAAATARPQPLGSRPPTPDSRLAAQPLGTFVASANGKKYYHPSCPEVRRIKEENLVWFDSEEEANESGYEPSKCVQKRP